MTTPCKKDWLTILFFKQIVFKTIYIQPIITELELLQPSILIGFFDGKHGNHSQSIDLQFIQWFNLHAGHAKLFLGARLSDLNNLIWDCQLSMLSTQ